MAEVTARQATVRSTMLAVAGALCAFVSPAGAQEPTTIGSATAVEGEVTVISHGTMTSKPLAAGDALHEGDHIETAADGRLRILLEDGSTVQVGRSSAIDLEWVLYAPALDSRNVILSVPSGHIRFIVEPLVPRSSFEVKTRTAITFVQGTDWIVAARSDSTVILALEGQVAVENVRPDVVGSTILSAGSGTRVKSGEPPAPAQTWPDERRQAFIRRTEAP